MRVAAVVLAAAAAGLALALPSGAGGPPIPVSIEFSDYRPDLQDVLPGETVLWSNVSTRTHTVTSDTGLFDSGDVTSGGRFSFTFNEPGSYRYHCTIHTTIVGEIDVRRVTLGAVPTAPLAVGTKVELDGRTADPAQPVTIQRRAEGAAFQTVATVQPGSDGTWKATVTADATADYRAAVGGDASETRRLIVQTRRISLQPAPDGISVTVAPSAPYSKFLVEVFLRERFGWWPVASGRVNYVSQADVKLKGPARVRAVLVDKDGWTPLATSKVVVLKKR